MSCYEYSRTHVRDLRNIAGFFRLSAPPGFWKIDEQSLTALYNGIGPEKWSHRFRRMTTWLLRYFESDALIHDYEYSLPVKSYKHFTIANLRFALNSVRLSFRSMNFFRAVKVSVLGLLLAVLCQCFGWHGYKDV